MISEVRMRKPKSATPGERVVRSDPPARVEKPHVGTLAYRFRDVIGAAPELPPDMAENHDAYPGGDPLR